MQVLLVKPVTFMNNSGESVGALAKFYKVIFPYLHASVCYFIIILSLPDDWWVVVLHSSLFSTFSPN